MTGLLDTTVIDTATVAVSDPYRISDDGCIHVTVSAPGHVDAGAWVAHVRSASGSHVFVESVDRAPDSPLSDLAIEMIVCRHARKLAAVIAADTELAEFRAEVALHMDL